MSVSLKDVRHIALLARLGLAPEEEEALRCDLDSILGYVAALDALDTSGVEPTAHASPIFNVWQADVAQPGLTVADALRNAPAQRDNMILVPKVVE